ncbi:hypothetical protein [Desulfatitalea alkaliphila]|uniref:Zinc-finger n=1 Tax=Desulfatitalea alkaliphila TaxID=2929485 RepID=A0AA41R2M8_9BACT|nr:hypothetical protein [Desulfatitalea alkaliphila]MCJ8501887.1 hypothetical protein [Desulfatitalea alkaliphila]
MKNMKPEDTHLNHEELLLAVVDRADLPPVRRQHLEQCARCHQALADAEAGLARMGRRARELAPAPGRPFRLPASVGRERGRRWIPLWLTAAAAVCALFIAVWGPSWWARQTLPEGPTVAAVDDEQFFQVVDQLVANALPASYQGLASPGAPAVPVDLDAADDFFDWVVPAIDDDEDLLT